VHNIRSFTMSDAATTRVRNRQAVPTNNSSNNQAADPALQTFELTKREAILLIHTGENFPRGFDEKHLAISLGWSTEEVREALQVCAVHGLIEGPPDIELPAGAPLEGSPVIGIDALLSPDEQDAARRSRVPCANHRWLALGEEFTVLRALGAGIDGGFTDDEGEAALEWAQDARFRSILLDLVLDGHIALMGPNGEGDMVFAALDADGELVINGREDENRRRNLK
jgi:hypothetical protein